MFFVSIFVVYDTSFDTLTLYLPFSFKSLFYNSESWYYNLYIYTFLVKFTKSKSLNWYVFSLYSTVAIPLKLLSVMK